VHYDVGAGGLGQWPPIISQFIVVVSSVNSWIQDGWSIALPSYCLIYHRQTRSCHIRWHVESYKKKSYEKKNPTRNINLFITVTFFCPFVRTIDWKQWKDRKHCEYLKNFSILYAPYMAPIKSVYSIKIYF